MRGKRAAALAGALALGVACGSAAKKSTRTTLAPAGSVRDDGSGLLARLSSMALHRTSAGKGYGGASYTTGSWGFGGDGYGGTAYGGGIYANYRFASSTPRDSDVANYGNNYVVDEKLKTGRITGRVQWGSKPASDELAASGCKAEKRAAGDVPLHAIVFLRKIKRGRGFPTLEGYPTRRWQVGGTLTVDACSISPYVQVVGPIGGVIRARLAHDGPDRLRDRDVKTPLAKKSAETTFAVDFTSRGDERIGQLRAAGPTPLANERGAITWVMTAEHPFYVSVDADGSFTLLDVPAGSYELVAWHPPVPVGAGKISAPLEVKRPIVVRVGKTSKSELRLPKP